VVLVEVKWREKKSCLGMELWGDRVLKVRFDRFSQGSRLRSAIDMVGYMKNTTPPISCCFLYKKATFLSLNALMIC